MKIRLRSLFLIIAVVSFGLAINALSAAAQDMPGMNMPASKPKAKQPAKVKPKAKAKTASKPKPKAASNAKQKPSAKTKKAKPKAKPTDTNMPMDTNIPMPSSTPTPKPKQTPIPMDMPMPTSSPSPSSTPMQMEMPRPAPAFTPMPSPMNMPMPTPTPTVQPTQKPMDMDMPMPSSTPPVGQGTRTTLPNVAPEKDFGEPVADNERYGSTLFDVLEFRPGRNGDSEFRWDIEGWYGTDNNRFFYKTEGEQNASKSDYDIDLQLLYARLISPYFNFQTGIRFEAHKFRGANIARPQAVFGFEGLAPYFIRLESGVFIDPQGKVSGRLTLTKDFLMTQRLIMQARFETSAAIQRVERFTTGRGLNDMELGFRFRYEYRRKFAPYAGITFARSFFETADLVRQDGGSPGQIRLALGARMFF